MNIWLVSRAERNVGTCRRVESMLFSQAVGRILCYFNFSHTMAGNDLKKPGILLPKDHYYNHVGGM